MYYTHENVGPLAYRTLIRLPSFERSARKLLSVEEERWLDALLGTDPEVGPVISGTGGVRKVRLALPHHGKRGGARVIYFHDGAKERVFLLFVYAKGVKANLTGAEKQQMRKLTALLKAER